MSTTQCEHITPNIGLSVSQCKSTTESLTLFLNDEILLSQMAKGYALNVTGPAASMYAQFFCDLAKELFSNVKHASQAVRMFGHRVPTIVDAVRNTRLEFPSSQGQWQRAEEMVHILLTNVEKLIGFLLKDLSRFEDKPLQAFVSKIINKHRGYAWKLRSHLEVSTSDWQRQGVSSSSSVSYGEGTQAKGMQQEGKYSHQQAGYQQQAAVSGKATRPV